LLSSKLLLGSETILLRLSIIWQESVATVADFYQQFVLDHQTVAAVVEQTAAAVVEQTVAVVG